MCFHKRAPLAHLQATYQLHGAELLGLGTSEDFSLQDPKAVILAEVVTPPARSDEFLAARAQIAPLGLGSRTHPASRA